jgi:hypothetical protein
MTSKMAPIVSKDHKLDSRACPILRFRTAGSFHED